MIINKNQKEKAKEEALEILESSENKPQAIVESIEKMNEAVYQDIEKKILEESNSRLEQESEKDFNNRMGLRALSSKEKEFYQALINNPKQALDSKQIDIFPTTIIDITLEDIKKENPLLNNINFAPAGVKKWLVSETSGKFIWRDALSTEKIAEELKGKIKGVDTEVNSLIVVMILPKAIRELSLPFVDKYVRAIMKEQLNEGLEYGAIQGTGVGEPIGMLKADAVNEDGTHKDKQVNTDLTNFSPKGLANAKKYLSKDGKRVVSKIVIICNPSDEATFLDPALYDDEGRMISSFKNIEKAPSAQCPLGKGILYIPGKYTLGLNNLKIKDYEETAALQNADLFIGSTFANGKAADENVAYVFDITKLEEYVKRVRVLSDKLEETVKDDTQTEQENNEI